MPINDSLSIEKAQGAAATSTIASTTPPGYGAGDMSFLIKDQVEAGIREYFEKRTPLWNQFRKENATSDAIVFKEQDNVPLASFGAELAALPQPNHAEYSERAVTMKSLYTRGELSGQLIAASSKSYVDAYEREIRNHLMGMIHTIEDKLVTGDSTTSPTEFDGLIKWVTNEVDASALNNRAGTPGPLTLSDMEVLQDSTTTGSYDLLIFDAATKRRLWSILQPQMRFSNDVTIDGGFTVPSYNGVPISIHRPHSAAGKTAMENVILGINKEQVWIPVLQDLTYEELAHTRDSTDFIIKMYLTLIVEGGASYHAKLTDFTTAVTI